jgi:hypothetical protein
LKYLHKGGAGTRAAAWYGSGSSKMILLWLWFGQLQLTGVETKVFVFVFSRKFPRIFFNWTKVAKPKGAELYALFAKLFAKAFAKAKIS